MGGGLGLVDASNIGDASCCTLNEKGGSASEAAAALVSGEADDTAEGALSCCHDDCEADDSQGEPSLRKDDEEGKGCSGSGEAGGGMDDSDDSEADDDSDEATGSRVTAGGLSTGGVDETRGDDVADTDDELSCMGGLSSRILRLPLSLSRSFLSLTSPISSSSRSRFFSRSFSSRLLPSTSEPPLPLLPPLLVLALLPTATVPPSLSPLSFLSSALFLLISLFHLSILAFISGYSFKSFTSSGCRLNGSMRLLSRWRTMTLLSIATPGR